MPFVLPDDLRNALLAYLGTKPYQEVAQAIAQMVNLQQVTPAIEQPPVTVGVVPDVSYGGTTND